MATELEKLQRRGQRVQDQLDRQTLRREKALADLLKRARWIDAANHRIKQLLRSRQRVQEAVGEMLRAEKRAQRRSATPPTSATPTDGGGP